MSETNEVLLSAQGEPYKTETAAKMAMAKKKLSVSANKVVPYKDGYGIVVRCDNNSEAEESLDSRKPADAASSIGSVKDTETTRQMKKMEYKVVVFQEKTSENQLDDVPLGFNGNVMLYQRGKRVIASSGHLESADHGVIKKHKLIPGEERKVVGRVKKFPYVVVRESNYAEFTAYRQKGSGEPPIEMEERFKIAS